MQTVLTEAAGIIIINRDTRIPNHKSWLHSCLAGITCCFLLGVSAFKHILLIRLLCLMIRRSKRHRHRTSRDNLSFRFFTESHDNRLRAYGTGIMRKSLTSKDTI